VKGASVSFAGGWGGCEWKGESKDLYTVFFINPSSFTESMDKLICYNTYINNKHGGESEDYFARKIFNALKPQSEQGVAYTCQA
jgi:hypothetical protein